MKEVRLSIPIIGGVTVIYTREDIEHKKAAIRRRLCLCVSSLARIGSKSFTAIANKLEGRPFTL